MKIIKFKLKDKWLVCDLDGTVKIFRTYPVRGETKWTGKGCQILDAKNASGLNVSWIMEPIKVVESRSLHVFDCDTII